MKPTYRNIERLFKVIDHSLFTTASTLPYSRVTEAITKLAYLVEDFWPDTCEADLWGIGEQGSCCLDELIIGAFWHYTDWHSGQRRDTYIAYCALAQIFSPGMTCCDADNEAYQALSVMDKGNQEIKIH